MRTLVYSARPYDHEFLDQANSRAGNPASLTYCEARLNVETARFARGFDAICAFVNDALDEDVLTVLSEAGVRLVAMRCSGFNNVDLDAALRLGITIARVPAYSPDAIAEHAVALMLALNRRIHKAYARVRDGNFALDGLIGFDMKGKVVGVVGTGKIGVNVARILHGFGCEVLASDPRPTVELGAVGGQYVSFDSLLERSDIITLHCPLTPSTYHLIGPDAVSRMKPGVMLINTSRGAVMDAQSVIDGLKSGRVGFVGLDVYEEEGDLFFENLSDQVIRDDVFARLLTFPNVLITGHQGFFTSEGLTAISTTTVGNIAAYAETGAPLHPVTLDLVA